MWLIFVLVFLAGIVVGSAGLVGVVAYSLGYLTKKSEKRTLAMASEAASKTFVIQDPKKDSKDKDLANKSTSLSDKSSSMDSDSTDDSAGSRRSISRQSSTNSSTSPTSSSTDDSVSSKAMDTSRKSANLSGRTKMLHKSPTESSSTSIVTSSGSTDDLGFAQRHSIDTFERRNGRLKREESVNLAGSSVEDEDVPQPHDAGPGGLKLGGAGSSKKLGNKSAHDFSASATKSDLPLTRARSPSVQVTSTGDLAVSEKFRRASGVISSLPPIFSDPHGKNASKVSRMLGLDIPMTARAAAGQTGGSMGVATSAAFSFDRSDSTSSLAAGDLMISSKTSLSSSQLIREQMQQLVTEGRISISGSPKSSTSISDSPSSSVRSLQIKHMQTKMITSSAPSTASGTSTPIYNGTPPTSRRGSTVLATASSGSGSLSKITHSAPPTAASTFSSSSTNLPTLSSVSSGSDSTQLITPSSGRESPLESATERFKLPEKDVISSRRNLSVQTAVPMRLVKRETFIKLARETANVDAQRRKVVIEVRESFGVLDAFSASESHSLFCRVAVCKQRYKTGFATRERGGRAKWGSGEMIVARVDAVHTDRIHFELMTRDRLYLGHAVTRLSDLLKDAQKDVWIPLKGLADHGKTKIPAVGELRVSLTLLAFEDPIPLTKPRSSAHTHDHSHDFKTSNSLAESIKAKVAKKKHHQDGFDSDSSSSSDSDSENISATEDSSESTTNYGRSRANSEAVGDWWDPASSKRVSVPISEKTTPLPPTGSYQPSPYTAPPGSTTAAVLSGGGWTGLGNLRGTNMPVASQSAPITRDGLNSITSSGDSSNALGGSIRSTVKKADTIATSTVPALSLGSTSGTTSPVPLVSATPSARNPLEPSCATPLSPSGVPAHAVPVIPAFTNPAVHDSQAQSEYVDPSVAVNTSPKNPRNVEPVLNEIGRDTLLNHDGTPVGTPEITRSNDSDKGLMTSRRASVSHGTGSSPSITHSSPHYSTIVSSGGSSSAGEDRSRVSFSPDAVRSSLTGGGQQCSVPGTTAPSVALSGMQYTPVAVYKENFDPPSVDAHPPAGTPYFIVGKQGWLNIKLAFKQSKWESRWCVLDGNAFRIYEDKYSQAALANLPLHTAKVSKMATKRHHIKLSLPKEAPYESAQLKPLPIPNDPASTRISPWFDQMNFARKLSRQYLDRAPPLPEEFLSSLSLPSAPSSATTSSAPPSIITSSAPSSLMTSITSSRESTGAGGGSTSRLSVPAPIDVSSVTHSTSTEVSPRPKSARRNSAQRPSAAAILESGAESDEEESDDETTDDDEFFSDYEGSSATESSAPRPPECDNMTPAELRAWKKKRAKEARHEKKRLKKLQKQAKKEASNSDKESKDDAIITPRPATKEGSKEGDEVLSSSSAASTPRSTDPTLSPRSSSMPLSRQSIDKRDPTAEVRGSMDSPIPSIATDALTTSSSTKGSKESKESRKRISRATSLKEDKAATAVDPPPKSPRATDNIVEAAIAGGIQVASGVDLSKASKKDPNAGDVTARAQGDSSASGDKPQMEMRMTTHDYDGNKDEMDAKVGRGQATPSLSKKEDVILGVESALVSVGVMKEDEMTEYIRKEEEEERRAYVLANVTPLKRIPDHVEAHDAGFLNLVLWRMFRDMQTSELFANDVAEKIRAKIETVKLPPFLGNLRVMEMDYGKDFIKLDSIKVVATEVPDEVVIEADVRYEGGLAVTLGIEFYLNWPRPKAATIPVTAIIKLKTLRGKLHILLPSQLNTKNSMCFVAPPAVEFDVSIDIGKGEGTYVSF